jgi:hypothetical protein
MASVFERSVCACLWGHGGGLVGLPGWNRRGWLETGGRKFATRVAVGK